MTDAAVLITGATGGLGREVALELARTGREIIALGRRPDAVQAICDEIEATTSTRAQPLVADLSDLRSVRTAIDAIGTRPLHGIVANAGLTTMEDLRSAQGFELTFAVNVLAHHLLLAELRDVLAPGGRVVVVSSGTHDPENRLARRSGIPVPRWTGTRALARPDEADSSLRLADGRQRYSTSKLGNVLQARALQAVLHAERRDVDVFAIDPGLMVDTDLVRELPAPLRWVFRLLGRLLTPFVDNMRLSSVSARHVASLMEDDCWHGRGFSYLDGDQVRPPSPDAQREELVRELWEEASALVGLEPTEGLELQLTPAA